MHRVYLDNAATSFPKPASVYEAVDRAQREVGAPEGRSATRTALQVHGVVERCRQRAARLLGAESPQRIVFTFNATDSLNLALHGLLRPGDHVVTSAMEHNSVLRPLRHLADRGIAVTYVKADSEGRVSPDDVDRAVTKNTRLVALVHASNVTGTIQPIDRVGEIARSAGALFLVDAAQTAGHLPLDVSRSPIDLLACAGHKGLLGPLGTGILYVRPGVEESLESVRQGGTGTNSEDDHQPVRLPDKYEAGNHNVPGLFGLEAALAWLEERTVVEVCRHERQLTAQLLDGVAGLPRLRVYGPKSLAERVGVVSLTIEGMDPQELAAVLDDSFGIETRAGLHCAPGAHRCLGTFAGGGTLRLSPGALTTEAEIEAAVSALRQLATA
ncbi:MAG TPA: aminotransferase class V-fold PLP-dependent enzyme [Planctomycetaceae bacterium]|nr:aminotransferase class V-fold PLP-dependent enzyme [Planctomycetaceae bacterium]